MERIDSHIIDLSDTVIDETLDVSLPDGSVINLETGTGAINAMFHSMAEKLCEQLGRERITIDLHYLFRCCREQWEKAWEQDRLNEDIPGDHITQRYDLLIKTYAQKRKEYWRKYKGKGFYILTDKEIEDIVVTEVLFYTNNLKILNWIIRSKGTRLLPIKILCDRAGDQKYDISDVIGMKTDCDEELCVFRMPFTLVVDKTKNKRKTFAELIRDLKRNQPFLCSLNVRNLETYLDMKPTNDPVSLGTWPLVDEPKPDILSTPKPPIDTSGFTTVLLIGFEQNVFEDFIHGKTYTEIFLIFQESRTYNTASPKIFKIRFVIEKLNAEVPFNFGVVTDAESNISLLFLSPRPTEELKQKMLDCCKEPKPTPTPEPSPWPLPTSAPTPSPTSAPTPSPTSAPTPSDYPEPTPEPPTTAYPSDWTKCTTQTVKPCYIIDEIKTSDIDIAGLSAELPVCIPTEIYLTSGSGPELLYTYDNNLNYWVNEDNNIQIIDGKFQITYDSIVYIMDPLVRYRALYNDWIFMDMSYANNDPDLNVYCPESVV